MIDYNATLKLFFEENIKYMERLRAKAKDEMETKGFDLAITKVRLIAENPLKFAQYKVRCDAGMEDGYIAHAFIPHGTYDNRAYLSFAAVLNSMGDLNSKFDYKRQEAQQKLLNALKSIKYRNSGNLLKDFTFPFKSPAHFAVRTKDKQY